MRCGHLEQSAESIPLQCLVFLDPVVKPYLTDCDTSLDMILYELHGRAQFGLFQTPGMNAKRGKDKIRPFFRKLYRLLIGSQIHADGDNRDDTRCPRPLQGFRHIDDLFEVRMRVYQFRSTHSTLSFRELAPVRTARNPSQTKFTVSSSFMASAANTRNNGRRKSGGVEQQDRRVARPHRSSAFLMVTIPIKKGDLHGLEDLPRLNRRPSFCFSGWAHDIMQRYCRNLDLLPNRSVLSPIPKLQNMIINRFIGRGVV
jgi:hypothetical protein